MFNSVVSSVRTLDNQAFAMAAASVLCDDERLGRAVQDVLAFTTSCTWSSVMKQMLGAFEEGDEPRCSFNNLGVGANE